MSTAAPIGWFEIAASDTDKAEAFYGEIFNWSFNADDAVPAYRIVETGSIPGGGVAPSATNVGAVAGTTATPR